jgi:hypothetical protein
MQTCNFKSLDTEGEVALFTMALMPTREAVMIDPVHKTFEVSTHMYSTPPTSTIMLRRDAILANESIQRGIGMTLECLANEIEAVVDVRTKMASRRTVGYVYRMLQDARTVV